MALFTSSRERRLWLWTGAAVATIYLSLGLTRDLSDVLRAHGLLEISFATGMILIAGAIAAHGLRLRPGGAEIAVALGIAAAYLLVLVRIEAPEERTHLIEYSVVAILLLEALNERTSNGGAVPLPPLTALLATAFVGTLDEIIQALIPTRIFDPIDILFNLLAGTMAVAGSTLLSWVRRRI